MADRLERLVNLTATLLETRRPLTLDELSDRVEPRYPEELAARRRQFERDKETLRELGIPIRIETADGFGSEQAYRIHPDDYYLPELELTEAELAALHVAVTAVRLEGDAGREGLAKLGGVAGAGADSSFAQLDVTPGLAVLFDAVSRHAPVSFSYRGDVRHLDPYGVVLRFGHWYVVGHDHDRDAPRAFRVDRIDGDAELGRAGAFTPPEGIDPADYVRADPMTYGEDQPVDAHVLVDAPRAGWVVDQLGEESVLERRPDGAVVVALPVVNRAAFRTWVIDLLDHAEVLSPPELRDDMVAWLDAVASGSRPRVQDVRGEPPARRPAVCNASSRWCRGSSRTPASRSPSSRTRFEVSERELERDLELLPMCGLPPYTADRLIDVSVIDGGVEIRLAEYFERPLRLTPAEGLALLAAGRALLSVPGSDADGPLATALAKLDDALGAPGSLAVDVGASDHLERLQDATAHDERVEIDYYSFARDEMTTRVIDPWRVFHAFGTWYVAAWCHRAEGERLFRVDRVRAVRADGRPLRPRDAGRRRAAATSCTTPAPTTRG